MNKSETMKPYFLLFPLWLILLAFCVSCSSVLASSQIQQDTLTAKVDQLLSQWEDHSTPGVAVAVVKDGAVVYQRGVGCANLEHRVAITPQTVFDAGSVAKQFTGYAVAMLAEQGRLSLDDPITQYVPDVPDFGGAPITLRHLLYHTSGLRDFPEALALAGYRMDDVITTGDVLAFARGQRTLNFPPGTQFLYSNTGYALLAEVVTRVTGQTLAIWLHEHVFEPLGMHQTRVRETHDLVIPHVASAYYVEPDGAMRTAVDNLAVPGPSSLFTTVEDLTKWLLHIGGLHVKNPAVAARLMQPGALDDATALTYGYGLRFRTHRGTQHLMHYGGWGGFMAYLGWFPEHRLGIALLTNNSSFNRTRVMRTLADLYLGHQSAPQAPAETSVAASPDTVRIDPSRLAAYEGFYEYLPGYLITIKREGNYLTSTPWNRVTGDVLLPLSASRFQVQGSANQMSFRMDENAVVTALILHRRNQETVARRIEPRPAHTLTADQFAVYVGVYHSEELATTYEVVAEDGQLYARHRRNPDVWLWPTDEPDRFTGREVPPDPSEVPQTHWWFNNVRFVRNEAAEVVAFEVTDLRVRNVRFDKVANAEGE